MHAGPACINFSTSSWWDNNNKGEADEADDDDNEIIICSPVCSNNGPDQTRETLPSLLAFTSKQERHNRSI